MGLIEAIASVQHEIWAHWMKYLFSVSKENDDGSYTIPSDKVDRWKRQMKKPYSMLLPMEKKSDIEQAKKVFNVLVQFARQNDEQI